MIYVSYRPIKPRKMSNFKNAAYAAGTIHKMRSHVKPVADDRCRYHLDKIR